MSELNIISDVQKIKDDNQFIVCCFYTTNYKTHANSLKQSLKQFNLDYYLCEVSDAGYWEANTRTKPHFIAHCLKKFNNKDILYIDADAVVKNSLDYFNRIDADIAVYQTDMAEGMSHQYLTGTIFLKNNARVKDFVRTWTNEQQNGKKIQVDQDSFAIAVQQMSELDLLPLKKGYVKIFDNDYNGKVFIEHNQASRQLTKLKRKKIRQRNRLLGGLTMMAVITGGFFLFK